MKEQINMINHTFCIRYYMYISQTLGSEATWNILHHFPPSIHTLMLYVSTHMSVSAIHSSAQPQNRTTKAKLERKKEKKKTTLINLNFILFKLINRLIVRIRSVFVQ